MVFVKVYFILYLCASRTVSKAPCHLRIHQSNALMASASISYSSSLNSIFWMRIMTAIRLYTCCLQVFILLIIFGRMVFFSSARRLIPRIQNLLFKLQNNLIFDGRPLCDDANKSTHTIYIKIFHLLRAALLVVDNKTKELVCARNTIDTNSVSRIKDTARALTENMENLESFDMPRLSGQKAILCCFQFWSTHFHIHRSFIGLVGISNEW